MELRPRMGQITDAVGDRAEPAELLFDINRLVSEPRWNRTELSPVWFEIGELARHSGSIRQPCAVAACWIDDAGVFESSIARLTRLKNTAMLMRSTRQPNLFLPARPRSWALNLIY
jgi:hypothetical protein